MGLIVIAIGSVLVGLGLAAYCAWTWRRSRLPLGRAFRSFLTPPAYADSFDTRRAALLTALILPVTAAVVVAIPLMALVQRDQTSLFELVLGAWSIDANLAVYMLARRGRLNLACWLYPFLVFLLGLFGLAGGSGNAGLATLPIAIITAGMLLGGPGAWVYATLSSLTGLAVLIIQAAGLRVTALSLTLAGWLEYVAIYTVVAVMLRLLTRRMDASIRQAERLQAVEAERSLALDQSLRLERKRARQLELLADSARQLTGINDPRALVDEAARRVVEGFNFEQAAVFLVQDDRLVVQASRGALGAARPVGLTLPLGEGLVGAVGRSGQTDWVREAANDARVALPVTSVVAIPLRLAKSVVGVLEIASTRPDGIEESDVRTLESLADLIAAGLQASQLFIQLRAQQQTTDALRRIGAAVNQSLELAQVVRTICEETRPAFDADQVEVWLLDGAGRGKLQRAAAILRNGQPPAAGEDLERRATVLAAHLDSERARLLLSPRFVAEAGDTTEDSAFGRSIIIAPLRREQQSLGLVTIAEWHRLRPFTTEDAASVDFLSSPLAAAVANAYLYADDRRRNAELQALHSSSLRVTSGLALQEVLESILHQSLELAGGQDAHIFLYDGEQLTFGAAIWAAGAPQETFAVPRPGGLTETVARTAQRIIVPHVDSHPLYRNWQWGGAIVGLPLRSGERICGVMNVAFEHSRQFDENELRLLDLLADQAAVAVENVRLFTAEREQRELAEALRAASVALSGSLEFEAVVDQLLDQIERVVPFDAAAILLVEPAGTQVNVARSRGYERVGPAAMVDLTLTANLQRMFETHRPLIVADTISHGPNRGDPDWSVGVVAERFHSWAGVPIVAHQQVIAFFTLDKLQAGYYQPKHADRLAAFAGQAALALQNARLFEAERRRAAQLTLLSEVSQQVSGTLDEALLLQRVVQAMLDRLGFAEAAILLPTHDDLLQVVAVATTEMMETDVGFQQHVGVGVIGHTAEIGAPYLTNDVGHDPYYFSPAGRTTGSALALPLKLEAGRPGVLYLEASTAGAFNAADVVAYETLANHVATALQNARLYTDARDRLSEMTASQSVSQTIVSSLELSQISETVVRLLRERFGYAYVSIYELRGDTLRLQAQVGYPDELVMAALPISQGVCGRTVRSRQTQFVKDVSLDPDFVPMGPSIGSEICTPLLTDRDVLGLLNVESGADKLLTGADVRLLSSFASQITVAVQNARLFEAEREQRQMAEALRGASLALSASLDYDTVLDRLLEQIERVVPFDTANIMLVDGNNARVARLRGYEQLGRDVAQAAAQVVFDVPSVPYLDRMARLGRPIIVSTTTGDPDWVHLALSAHVLSWAGAPVIAQGEVLAFFSLDKTQAGFYQPWHGARLEAFVGQAALALENARLFAAQQRRAEEQRLLVAAARDFSAALSMEAVLQAIVRHMTQVLDAASCTISQWQRDQDVVITLYDYVPEGALAGEPRGATYSLAEYPATRRVLSTRQPLVIDVDDPAADASERRGLEKWGQGRLLMVPLSSGDDVFGLVEVLRGPGSQPFRETDQQLALSLAAQAAIALENAQLHAALQENVRELDALLKANEALLSTLELDPLLHNILAAAAAAVPSAEKGAIVLYEPASQQMRVRATIGYRDPRIQSIAFGKDQGYLTRVMRENQPLLIRDAVQEPPLGLAADIPELGSIVSAMVAPLAPKGTPAAPQGVIRLDATRPDAFSSADLRILVAFANTAAVAIDNARLHAEVQRLAVTDSLTALANPRAFEQALATEAYRAARYGHPLSVVIMDIDSFKLYNDTYGHLAGNDRLRAIADILHGAVRDPDLPVRYGGEEFALLLPHTHKAGAIILAERIRAFAQAAAPAPGEAGQPISGYTLSLGVATLPTDALSAGQLLLAADNAELQAKRGGKNRVCAAEALVADGLPDA